MHEPLLTTAEVAEQLRKSTRFIRDEFARGALRGSRFGGELHFNPNGRGCLYRRPPQQGADAPASRVVVLTSYSSLNGTEISIPRTWFSLFRVTSRRRQAPTG
jgi:hypothetical protein